MIEAVARIVSPELIGRAPDLDRLARALDDARAGRPRTVVVGGEAGIGKSRLLAEGLGLARRAGSRILVGGCVGLAEGSLPLAPIVEALRPLFRAAGEESSGDVTGGQDGGISPAALGAVRTVAAELGLGSVVLSGSGAVAAELRPEWARSRLYEAVLELVRRLGEASTVVLAIEDLHWSDDSTRELLAFLIRNVRDEPLLIVITFRSDELHRRHPLLPWLAEVDRAAGVERLELHRLGRTDVARQLEAILGTSPPDDLVGSVFRRSEGNPFYAEELVAAGVASRRLPPTLREVLAARLSVVSDGTLGVLGVAAIAGRRVDHDLLAEVAGIPEEALLEALREATAAQLVVADENGGAGWYTFRHSLIGEAAAETVLPGERRRLHVAIAEALERDAGRAGAERAVRLAELAHHWHEAHELDRAFAASIEAGRAAFESQAYAESQRQLERALELWDLVPDGRAAAGLDRAELLRLAARSAQVAGTPARARAHLRAALDLLDEAAEPVRVGLLFERLGRAYWVDGQIDEALRAYARAVELVPGEPPTADRARVLAGYAQALMLKSRYSESLPIGQEALAMAKAADDRQIEGHALTTIASNIAYLGDKEQGIELARKGLAIAEEVGDLDDIGRGHANTGSLLDLADRREEAVALSLAGAERMRQAGLGTSYGAFLQLNAVDGLYALGRWDEARRLADEVVSTSLGTVAIFGHELLGRLLVGQGELEAGRAALDVARQRLGPGTDAQFNGPLALGRLELAVWTGDLAAGRRAADEAISTLSATEDAQMMLAIVGAAARVEADAAERARAARDGKAEAEALQRAAELDRRLADAAALPGANRQAPEIASVIALAMAELGRARGENMADTWREAARIYADRGIAYVAAYATYRAAEALLETGNRGEAAPLLADAARGAAAFGAKPLAEAIAGLAGRARISLGASVASVPSGASGPSGALKTYGLTPREVEVLRLLAAGRTNRQIAEELFISESTAGVHVSHILGKLGVSGRVEAAAIAVRLGVAD